MSRAILAPLVLGALALPGAASALGLGEIRVRSALNEPLSAQIAVVGASPEDLQGLRATIADADLFRRYNADRPAYLSGVVVRVIADTQGHTLLDLRSDVAFTDPLVELLVDVRWAHGELIRDFPLLLDPAVSLRLDEPAAASAPSTQNVAVAALASPAPTPTAAPTIHAELSPATPAPALYRVRPRDTLSFIVRRAGAVHDADAQRMMMAVFRANPAAFDGNINRLHRNALLAIPSLASLAALDAAQARREFTEQMSAWRLALAARTLPAAATLAEPVRSAPGTPEDAPPLAPDPRAAARVDSADLPPEAKPAQEPEAQAPSAPLAMPHPAAVASAVARPPGQVRYGWLLSITLAAGLCLLGLAIARARRARRPGLRQLEPALAPSLPAAPEAPVAALATVPPPSSAAAPTHVPADDAPTTRLPAADDETHRMPEATATMEQITAQHAIAANAGETTIALPSSSETVVLEGVVDEDTVLEPAAVDEEVARARGTPLDYNLLDLDAADQHVQLPSDLNGRTAFVERRTSVADALRSAIARDPSRNDLRMKLFETYYAAAASNLRAFADFANLHAGEPASLTDADWRRIAQMGRELGLELDVPETVGDDDLADCA